MYQVKILSGVSGSGKSFLADVIMLDSTNTVTYCSADTFFIKDGVYLFNSTYLSDAHGHCFREFITGLQDRSELIVIDNTNLSPEEIAPYILGAQAYRYEAEILTLRVDLKDLPLLVARNKHGVGEQSILRQYNKLNERKLMPWWNSRDISVEF